MTAEKTIYKNNHFKIFARTLPDEYRLFEFEFRDYDEFIANPNVRRAIERYTDFSQLSLMTNTKSWMTEYGRKTKTFYTAIMERNKRRNWHVFGAFYKEIDSLPKFDNRITYQGVII